MQRLQQSMLRPLVATSIAVLTVLYLGLAPMSTAHAQRISEAVAVAIVPFADHTGRNSEMIATKATDAAALALDASKEYVVMPRADTQREMEALGVANATSPLYGLSEEQMVRLGERLRVSKVCNGVVEALSIDKSGRCRCRITLRLLDVGTEEYLDGATSDYTTKPIPGWEGDEASVMNEAFRSAAEECIRKIQTTRRPRGNVDNVEQTGQVLVNLGFKDGIEVGTEFLVVRGIWNAATEKVVLRKIGVVEAKQIDSTFSRCAVTSGMAPRTGDKVYVMYRPTQTVQKAAAKSRMKTYTLYAVGFGALLGIYNAATGSDNQSAPGISAYLTQTMPGSEPRVRVTASVGGVPGNTKTFGWLVYRGDYAGFPAMADDRDYLISAIQGQKLGYYEDSPATTYNIDFSLDFTYNDESGDQTDGNCDATYNHNGLVAGSTYFYKLRRVVDPGRVILPTTTTGVHTGQAARANVTFTIDPTDALGEQSEPGGPVTFFYPPTLELPTNNNAAVDPTANTTVFTWEPSVGADTYQVMIYKNQLASGIPVKLSPELTNTSSTGTMSWRLPTALDASTTYYWFVGAKKSGETAPYVSSISKRGWLLAGPYTFTTAPTPPTPPGTSGVSSDRPAGRSGWWRETPAPKR